MFSFYKNRNKSQEWIWWVENSIKFTNVCAIGAYGVLSVHTCWRPDHSDVLSAQDSKQLKVYYIIMPILTFTEHKNCHTVPYMRSLNQPYIVRNVFIWLSWEQIFSLYQIIIENGVYIWTGTFNVTINEDLCEYNVTKYVTFISETPYLHICIPISPEIEIYHIKNRS